MLRSLFKKRKKNNGILIFKLCFDFELFDQGLITDLIKNKDLGYKADILFDHGSKKKIDNNLWINLEEKAKKNLLLKSKGYWIEQEKLIENVKMNKWLTFARLFPYTPNPPLVITWVGHQSKLDLNAFESLFTHEAFVNAYCCGEQDYISQNEEDLEEWILRNIDTKNEKIYMDEVYEDEKFIDLDGKPGRGRQVFNSILISCWKMWFGKHFFKIIKDDDLKNFSECYINKLIFSDTIRFIQLHENAFDAYKYRHIQKNFNNSIKIEEVYERATNNFGLRI